MYFISSYKKRWTLLLKKENVQMQGNLREYQATAAEAQQLYDVSTTKNGSGGKINAVVFRCQHRMS